MLENYTNFAGLLYGSDPAVRNNGVRIHTVAKIPAPPAHATLESKFPQSSDLLTLGCSEADMRLDIRRGIYGRPWVGEAYHSHSNFNNLYSGANGDVMIANCSGYKGGGTAATFIPLSAREASNVLNSMPGVHFTGQTFSIITGPSTEFAHSTRIPDVSIYGGDIPSEVDLFEIPEMTDRLNKRNVNGTDRPTHESNIRALQDAYKRILDPESKKDYRQLNPSFYMGRFIDRIHSDASLTSCINFVTLKPDLHPDQKGVFHYDITDEKFEPDNQDHMLHISNLINALIIQEIAVNHTQYTQPGSIYSFCCPSANYFNTADLFPGENSKQFYRFIAFSVILIKYVCSFFANIAKPGAEGMLTKWAADVKKGFGWKRAVTDDTQTGIRNILFANAVRTEITQFVTQFIVPILQAMLDIQNTSSGTVVLFETASLAKGAFPNGKYGIIKDLITNCTEITDNPLTIMQTTNQILAALIMGVSPYPTNFDQALTTITSDKTNFMKKYQNLFPEFGFVKARHREWDSAVKDADIPAKAAEYSKEIIAHTYKQVRDILIPYSNST
ncbi:MAG: hypothetical protein K6F80_00635 [Oscillospiraceae bacterium]|nr:hypothetical protein [Oscillospiraceae bacterium]